MDDTRYTRDASFESLIERGDFTSALLEHARLIAVDEPLVCTTRTSLQLVDAGHFRMLDAWLKHDPEQSPVRLAPAPGIAWLCGLMLDEPTLDATKLYQALAAPSSGNHADIALAMACIQGHAFGLVPRKIGDKGIHMLSQAALSLERLQQHDDAAATLLRLASIHSGLPSGDHGVALALCTRAQQLAREEGLIFEADLECKRLRVRLGMDPIETLLPAISALADGLAPVTPGQRARLLIKLAESLLGSHPLATGWLTQGARLAQANGQVMQLFRASMALASSALSRADREAAAGYALSAREQAEDIGFATGRYAAELLLIQLLAQQGNRDHALQRASDLSELLRHSLNLINYGAPLASLLSQMGPSLAAERLIGHLRRRLVHHRNEQALANAEAAHAACALAHGQQASAMQHHRRARHLHLLAGDTVAAAEQSLGMAQLAFMNMHASGEYAPLIVAQKQARDDLAAVPSDQLLPLRAQLAQIEGQALFMNGELLMSSQRLLEARKLFDSLGDMSNSAFVESLRGLVLLKAGMHGDTDALRCADDAFSRARLGFDSNLPHEASRMLFYRATTLIELAYRTDDWTEREPLIDQGCALVAECWARLESDEADNTLTFDLGTGVAHSGRSLREALNQLAQRLVDASEIPPASAERLIALIQTRAPSAHTRSLH